MQSGVYCKADEFKHLHQEGERLDYALLCCYIRKFGRCDRQTRQTRKHQLQSTLKTLRQALTQARSNNDCASQANLLKHIGLVHCTLEEYAWGVKCLEQALQIAREMGNQALVGVILYYMGVAYRQTDQDYKALRVYLQALAIFQAIADELSVAKTFNQLGAIYRNLGQLEQAQRYSHQALRMFHDLGNSPQGEAATLQNLGEVYLQVGRPRQALAFFEQALALHRKIGDVQSEAITLESIGTAYVSLNREQHALEFYHHVLEMHRRMGESPNGDVFAARTREARSLDYIGAVHYKLSNYPLAVWYHLQALDILHALHQTPGSMMFLYDTTGSQRFLQHLKTVYDRLGLHTQGVKCYQQILEIIETFGYRASEEAIQNYFDPESNLPPN